MAVASSRSLRCFREVTILTPKLRRRVVRTQCTRANIQRTWLQLMCGCSCMHAASNREHSHVVVLLSKSVSGHLHLSFACAALWSLSTSGQEERTAIAQAGAIAPLVEMLETNMPRPLARAAGALAGLSCEHPTNQDATTAAGGIPLLVELLGGSQLRSCGVYIGQTRDEVDMMWEQVRSVLRQPRLHTECCPLPRRRGHANAVR